jgi:hypothetical protein
MHQFVIERAFPGAGQLTQRELGALAQKSNGVLDGLGTDVQWVHSYVTTDKIYCVYRAKNPELVREHARRGGFPADSVARVHSLLDPCSAEA